jgi:hypothetical protein
MKKYLLLLLLCSGNKMMAQGLEPAVHAMGAMGMDEAFTPAMLFSIAANSNRFYGALAIVVTGDRLQPPVLGARAGFIFGNAIRFVPYAGYNRQSAATTGEKVTVSTARSALCIGALVTYPIPDTPGAAFIDLQHSGVGTGFITMVGIKMRLTRGGCE